MNNCADCGRTGPQWASLNRCVVICDTCCAIHRTLGRHVSQLKSLSAGYWPPSQLQMIKDLVNSYSNSIWEYTLVSQQGKQPRKKKDASEPSRSNLSEFIQYKYQQQGFSAKPDKNTTVDDSSQQLYSSVRTNNLETSLRLLSCGADPSWIHPSKKNTAFHVAAATGQLGQIELLRVYGASPSVLDGNNKRPIEVAVSEGHHDVAERLHEMQYETTDKLCDYIFHKRPNHRESEHLFSWGVLAQRSNELRSKSATDSAMKNQLESLTAELLSCLIFDLSDEVERRELDVLFKKPISTSTSSLPSAVMPFLPVNPEFSPTRNQSRQKLGRLSSKCFEIMIVDVLMEIQRRVGGDSFSASRISPTEEVKGSSSSFGAHSNSFPMMDSTSPSVSANGDSTPLLTTSPTNGAIPDSNFTSLSAQMQRQDETIRLLVDENKNLNSKISLLHNMVSSLMQQKSFATSNGNVSRFDHGGSPDLNRNSEQPTSGNKWVEMRNVPETSHNAPSSVSSVDSLTIDTTKKLSVTPQTAPNNPSTALPAVHLGKMNTLPELLKARSSVQPAGSSNRLGSPPPPLPPSRESPQRTLVATKQTEAIPPPPLQDPDEVMNQTERLTRSIHQLFMLTKVDYVPGHFEAMRDAVTHEIHSITRLIAPTFSSASASPPPFLPDQVKRAVNSLSTGSLQLSKLPPPRTNDGNSSATDAIIRICFELANATKTIVTAYTAQPASPSPPLPTVHHKSQPNTTTV